VNVKPNDIARVVGLPKNANRICRVLRAKPLYNGAWVCEALQTFDGYCYSPIGEHRDIVIPPGTEFSIFDTYLRPLHDGDGVDETLRAGKPNETPSEIIEAITA
jgi:hypothetical protein